MTKTLSQAIATAQLQQQLVRILAMNLAIVKQEMTTTSLLPSSKSTDCDKAQLKELSQ